MVRNYCWETECPYDCKTCDLYWDLIEDEKENKKYIIKRIMWYVKKNGTGITEKDLMTYDYKTLRNALECEEEKWLEMINQETMKRHYMKEKKNEV